ncbi:tetratricopeptide (TPR) repeat protein [Caldicoprobacter guelmensis]|uniref:hypothetical protein n=1 Tax=Caldicoprobacter guelmensis TaxID=1170224 RepID=UPI00195BF4FA|nr:hypothetical protein [Caldicoprobacter guelmensis]MBM7582903.1 tetratricopeptide (TPR) repeat protein [Caldicoprobacter guelmensis]
MKIVKMQGPLSWKSPASKGANAQGEASQKSDAIEQRDLNQANLNIMVRSRFLKEIQPINVLDLALNDAIENSKNNSNNDWRKLWSYDAEASIYQNIRHLILQRRIEEAESVLSALPLKTAQWYYLNGMVLWEKGLYADAYDSIQQAVNMAPENREYREVLYHILRAYHPFLALRFCKRVFKKALPLIYIILIFLCITWLVSRFV